MRAQAGGVAQQLHRGHLGVHHAAAARPVRDQRLGAGHPGPPTGQVRHHRADVVVGDGDLDRVHRLEHLHAPVPRAASLTASAPAVWNAASEESTLWDLPSQQGHPDVDHRHRARPRPRPADARAPFSTEPMKLLGTAPPTTWSTNSTPAAARQRLDLDVADRVLAVAAGLLDLPTVAAGGGGERGQQRHPHRLGVDRGAAGAQPGQHHLGVRLAQAPQHQLAGVGVALDPHAPGRRPTSRVSALASASSSLRVARGPRPAAAVRAAARAGSTSGWRCSERVSPVSALASRATTQKSPANAEVDRVASVGPSSMPVFSSASWSGWPRSAPPWPETCSGGVGGDACRRRPGPATAGPGRGPPRSGPPRRPAGRPGRRPAPGRRRRSGCSSPAAARSRGRRESRCTIRSSSSRSPKLASSPPQTGTTGWKCPRPTAVCRSAVSTAGSRSSPDR